MVKLSSKHLFFFIAGVAVVAMKTYPTLFTKISGRDTWLCVILSSVLIVLYLFYILSICKKTNCYDILQIYKQALGKYIGYFFILLFAMNLFLNLVESSSVEASAMNTNFLINTPIWSFLLVTVLSGAYIVDKGFLAILNCVLICIIAISVSGTILFLLTWKYKDFYRLLPILEHGINMNFIISTIKLLGLYGSALIVFPFLTGITDKKSITKFSILALIYVSQMEIVSMIGNISTFEISRLNALVYPKLTQTQLISHYGFLEAGELFVMLQLVGGWFIKYIITFFALTKILENFKLNINLSIYSISAGVFICSYFGSKNLFTLFHLLNYLVYINLTNYIVFPLIIYSVFAFRHR